jgi:hypothetical protein
VTANFILGEQLKPGHIASLVKNIGPSSGTPKGKGCIYISPLKGTVDTKGVLEQFKSIKLKSRMETFLYLIQRL